MTTMPSLASTRVVPLQAGRIESTRVKQTLDRYLDDDAAQRVSVGAVSGAGLAVAGLGATALGLLSQSQAALAGPWGVGAGAALGLLAGGAIGTVCTRRLFPNRDESAFMNAYMLGAIGGFGCLITAATAQGAGGGAGALCTVGLSLLGAVAGGAMRMGASSDAARDLAALEQEIDRAIEVEGFVLRNAEAAAKTAQPGGQVTLEEGWIVVGGVRVPRGERRA